MESGAGAKAKAANPSEKSSSAPSSVAFDTRSSLAFDLPRGAFSRRGGVLMRPGMTREMIIMIFSIKFYKFTGFFDKFLKIISLVTGFNTRSYCINLSVAHSDSRPKKVFLLPRICSQLPAFAGGPMDGPLPFPAAAKGAKKGGGAPRSARRAARSCGFWGKRR